MTRARRALLILGVVIITTVLLLGGLWAKRGSISRPGPRRIAWMLFGRTGTREAAEDRARALGESASLHLQGPADWQLRALTYALMSELEGANCGDACYLAACLDSVAVDDETDRELRDLAMWATRDGCCSALEPSECDGSLACAKGRTRAAAQASGHCGSAVADRDVPMLFHPLEIALEHDDCKVAGEYIRALSEVVWPTNSSGLSMLFRSAVQSALRYCGKRAAKPPPPADISSARIEYKRYCFGDCPTYSLKVSGDGVLSFDGNGAHGRVRHEGRLLNEETIEFFSILDRIGFDHVEGHFTSGASDYPTTRITLEWRGAVRVTEDEHLCGPPHICYVERKLHAMAVAQGWVDELRGADNGGP
jgi:hypothetical protein